MLCVVVASAQVGDSKSQAGSEEDKIYKQSEVDEKPQIKKKPRANYENSYGQCAGQGVVRLKIVLLKTGRIGEVGVIDSSQCEIFDQNAINAAKKIKFKPALKNGQAVSVSVLVEYSYRVF